nr:MAG TPA: intron associated endonuclease [Caudoviricetes sp.]
MFSVYIHENKVNGKVYIGMTSQDPPQRWGRNGCKYKSSPHFYSAIQKYGWDNFEHRVLFENMTREEATKKEIELIEQYCSIDRRYGYNSTSGGECCSMNDETRQKMSIAMRGNKNNMGHHCNENTKRKISQAHKGRVLTEEHKHKLSEAAKRRHTPCSEEKREKISAHYPNKRRVYCKELDAVYESVQECGRVLGIPATSISKLCKGRGKTLKGYHLQYFDDTIKA